MTEESLQGNPEPGAAIVAAGLAKHYGRLVAVRGLSLTVSHGEVFGFLGPNGAGKSTTIRMLCGLLAPTAGSARVASFDLATETLDVKRRVGYLSEQPYLYPKLTGVEFLRFLADLYGVEPAAASRRAEQLLTLFDLREKAGELIEGYSHGMRQKIALAGALIHDPQVLFLDEPTSGLDPKSARAVKDLVTGLAARGRAVFFSTHVLEIAQSVCHRVGIIERGELVAVGTLEQLRSRAREGAASLEDIFLQLTGGPEAKELAAFLED